MPVMDVDRVVHVQRGTWKREDARERVQNTRVIGRARIELQLGPGLTGAGCPFVVDALVVASERTRDLGDRFAVFFHPEDGRLIALPMEGT